MCLKNSHVGNATVATSPKNLHLQKNSEANSVGYGGSVDPSGLSASRGSAQGWQWFKNPRLNCLGFRGIFPSNTIREAIPLEYNLAGLNAISFDKGCYVDQELIARAHDRGVIRKRLFLLKFLDDSGKGKGKEVEQRVGSGSEVMVSATGKKAGTVNTALGSRGVGLLRLEEAFKGTGNLSLKGHEDVKVGAIRPKWWLNEWDLEHQQHTAAA